MKQFILSCFLLIRLSEYHVSLVGSEHLGWSDKSVDFILPVNCRTLEKINVGDDFLQSRYMRQIVQGDPRRWSMKVVRKIIVEDAESSEFACD